MSLVSIGALVGIAHRDGGGSIGETSGGTARAQSRSDPSRWIMPPLCHHRRRSTLPPHAAQRIGRCRRSPGWRTVRKQRRARPATARRIGDRAGRDAADRGRLRAAGAAGRRRRGVGRTHRCHGRAVDGDDAIRRRRSRSRPPSSTPCKRCSSPATRRAICAACSRTRRCSQALSDLLDRGGTLIACGPCARRLCATR